MNITFFFNSLYNIYINEVIRKLATNFELKSYVVLIQSIAICWQRQKTKTTEVGEDNESEMIKPNTRSTVLLFCSVSFNLNLIIP